MVVLFCWAPGTYTYISGYTVSSTWSQHKIKTNSLFLHLKLWFCYLPWWYRQMFNSRVFLAFTLYRYVEEEQTEYCSKKILFIKCLMWYVKLYDYFYLFQAASVSLQGFLNSMVYAWRRPNFTEAVLGENTPLVAHDHLAFFDESLRNSSYCWQALPQLTSLQSWLKWKVFLFVEWRWKETKRWRKHIL